jgi:hypothetical protein
MDSAVSKAPALSRLAGHRTCPAIFVCLQQRIVPEVQKLVPKVDDFFAATE